MRALLRKLLTWMGAAALIMLCLSVISSLCWRGNGWQNGNVGHVRVEGMIASAETTVKALNDFRENDAIKAIVLRIDSPGGPIAPAQEIYQAVKLAASKKPVVVSMGSVAASGGYYIAAPATKIVANPGTVTGSIGVIMQHFMVDALVKKLNIRWEIIKAGEVKDMGSPLRDFTPKERVLLTDLSRQMHQQFIQHVAEGRNLPIEDIRKLATGAIYSGEQALNLKLVDQLGGADSALELAGKLAKLKDKPKLVESQRPEGFMERFFEKMFSGKLMLLENWLYQAEMRNLLPMAISRY